MDHALERYLDDHLAGSSGALLLIRDIAERIDIPEAKIFFDELAEKIEKDRGELEKLQEAIRKDSSTLLQAAGSIAARISGLKFRWEGFEPGSLGLFEVLEVIALGVTGKRLLWKALRAIRPAFPEWESIDLEGLEREASDQFEKVEHWRIEAAKRSLVSDGRGVGWF